MPDAPEQRSLPFDAAPAASGFASLGSGSRGNGTVIRLGGVTLLIDCGFTLKQTTVRLARFGIDPDDLTAILVTHEHSDHVAGVGTLARRHDLPVYLSQGTARATTAAVADWQDLDLRIVAGGAEFAIGDVAVAAVPVPHDAREPVQYVVEGCGRRCGVLTDLGHVPAAVIERYRHCDGLLVESNHDLDMLQRGSYAPFLKRRVGGPLGHLNNTQSLAFIDQVLHQDGMRLLIGHISDKNNCPQLLAGLYARVRPHVAYFEFASQSHGSAWVDLD